VYDVNFVLNIGNQVDSGTLRI